MPIDYSKYPSNWKSEIVPRILKRAKNKCEICGLENRQDIYSMKIYIRVHGKYGYRSIWFSDKADADRCNLGIIKKVRVILTVAHLDHDETNHNVTDDRLKAMCQKCHLAYDAEEKYKRILKNATQTTSATI